MLERGERQHFSRFHAPPDSGQRASNSEGLRVRLDVRAEEKKTLHKPVLWGLESNQFGQLDEPSIALSGSFDYLI